MKIIKYIFFGLLFWMIIHCVVTINDGLQDNNEKADVAVILGNKVNEDGTLSTRLMKRLQCGLNLYQSGRVKTLIVSGGLGKEGFYEGDKMKEFLIKKGVPDSVIIVDNEGDNTQKTVENTMRLQDSLHFKTVIVASQYYHITRTKMLFRKTGFTEVSGASPRYFELKDIYALFREFVAYYKQLIFE